MNNQESVIPTTYTHSLKLEETAKGIRISVHIYAQSGGRNTRNI
jgi:hypothetical protein